MAENMPDSPLISTCPSLLPDILHEHFIYHMVTPTKDPFHSGSVVSSPKLVLL